MGITQETGGRVPFRAAAKNFSFDSMLSSWFVFATALKPGNGFCTGAVSTPPFESHGGTTQVPGPT